jgi:hypothetical protein
VDWRRSLGSPHLFIRAVTIGQEDAQGGAIGIKERKGGPPLQQVDDGRSMKVVAPHDQEMADALQRQGMDPAFFLDLQLRLCGPDVVAKTGDGDPGDLHGAFLTHGTDLLV